MSVDLPARYAAAEALLPHRQGKLVLSGQVQPSWIGETDTFWYRSTNVDGTEFVLVDPVTGTGRPAFDHHRLAAALGHVLDEAVAPNALPFRSIELLDDMVRVEVGRRQLEVSLSTYAATLVGVAPAMHEVRSPDGKWVAFVRDHNIVVRELATGRERAFTTDGVEAFSYGTPPDIVAARPMMNRLGMTFRALVMWSPDSSRLLTHRTDQRDLDLMHLVQSSPYDGGRPTLMSYRYAMVGDPAVATAEFFVFDVATGESTQAKCEPVQSPYVSPLMVGHAWWGKAGDTVFWISGARGDKTLWLRAMNARTGEVGVRVEETSTTTAQPAPFYHGRNARTLRTGETLWWSERSGWGHLYLYDSTGRPRQLTSGDWVLRDVGEVDEDNRTVLVTAAGREPGLDPYVRSVYRLSLDTGDLVPVTSDRLDHDLAPAPSGRFVVDVQSDLSTPGISVVRNSAGDIVLELERADASALFAAGYSVPERVAVKAADGETDIYCVIYRPHQFDPTQKYAVLDEIYPGPQVGAAPVRFPQSGGPLVAARECAAFAALGFAVVAIDGRGTPSRSKAFQDHARLVRDGDNLDDHVAALRQLAATRPWMDLNRVGIYGHSGGGYASARAMLTRPDFFKVAVSSAGDHDDLHYHAMWGEKFYGPPGCFDYTSHSNITHAQNLQGKLLLVHGELDDNVTPHQTMRLIDALMSANKDFDLLIVPNADHGLFDHRAYWLRRRWDYFVRHLQCVEPPTYQIADIPLDPDFIAELMGI